MRKLKADVLVHVVWTTENRLPWLTEEVRQRVYGALRATCEDTRCRLLEVGGTADHVHILFDLHPTLALSDFVKDLKVAATR